MVVINRDRYVVFHLTTKSSFPSLNQLKAEIWNTYQELFGLDGTSEAGLYFEAYDEGKGSGVVRCSNKSLPLLLTVFAIITEVNNEPVILQSLYVSGLINKAKEYLCEIEKHNHNVD